MKSLSISMLLLCLVIANACGDGKSGSSAAATKNASATLPDGKGSEAVDKFARPAAEAEFAAKIFAEARKGDFVGLIPYLRPERGFEVKHREDMEKARKNYDTGGEFEQIRIARECANFGVEDIVTATLPEWAAKREFYRRAKRDESFPQGLKDLGEPIFEDDESEGAWWIARMGIEGKQALALAIKRDPEGGEYYVSYIDYAPWAERANKSK